jgi:hypothetical protein
MGSRSRHVTAEVPIAVWDELDTCAHTRGATIGGLACEILARWAASERARAARAAARRRRPSTRSRQQSLLAPEAT